MHAAVVAAEVAGCCPAHAALQEEPLGRKEPFQPAQRPEHHHQQPAAGQAAGGGWEEEDAGQGAAIPATQEVEEVEEGASAGAWQSCHGSSCWMRLCSSREALQQWSLELPCVWPLPYGGWGRQRADGCRLSPQAAGRLGFGFSTFAGWPPLGQADPDWGRVSDCRSWGGPEGIELFFYYQVQLWVVQWGPPPHAVLCSCMQMHAPAERRPLGFEPAQRSGDAGSACSPFAFPGCALRESPLRNCAGRRRCLPQGANRRGCRQH